MTGESSTLAMHAVLSKSSVTNGQNGIQYDLGFEVPIAFIDYLKDLFRTPIDVYWNEVLVGHGASLSLLRAKPVKDSDPIWQIGIRLSPQDNEDLPSIQREVGDVGDLRLYAQQLALFTDD